MNSFVESLASKRRQNRIYAVLHYASLALVAFFLIRLGDGHWFFYDEWTFLLADRQWDFFTPHNGHLSFFIVLFYSTLVSIFGVSSYWPFLALALFVHLAIVHLIWRVLVKQITQPLVALLVPLAIGFMGAGAENIFWAFQSGFMLPIALGLGAFLVADSSTLSRRRLAIIYVLLFVALFSASTAFPMIAAVCVFVLVRFDWKPAVALVIGIASPYLLWRAVVQPEGLDFGVQVFSELFSSVPEYFLTAYIDGLSKVAPLQLIAPAIVVAAGFFLLRTGFRVPFKDWPIRYFLVSAAFLFTLSTALTRLQLGAEQAASGRYVYVLVVLFAPVVAFLLSSIAVTSRLGLWFSVLSLVLIIGFNYFQLVAASNSQRDLEMATKRQVGSVSQFVDDARVDATSRPLPVLAPTMNMGMFNELIQRGLVLAPNASPADTLSVETNLFLRAETISDTRTCARGLVDELKFDLGSDRTLVLDSPTPVSFNLVSRREGSESQYTYIELLPGPQRLIGLEDAEIVLYSTSGSNLCLLTDTQ